MATKSISISVPRVMKSEIEALVESGEYSSRSDVIRDAFRTFMRINPEKKINAAVKLYKKEKVSLTRAAEMDIESFKQELIDRGLTVRTYYNEE
ncbi:MAG: UPF0175 family protein [Thermoplasmata archaeon]